VAAFNLALQKWRVENQHSEEQLDAPGILRISADAAKRLFPEYIADPVGTDRDVTAAAELIAQDVLETMLAASPEPGREIVLMCAGTPGSGKNRR